MTQTLTLTDALDFVAGASREEISLINRACNDRSKHLSLIASATNLAELKPGDYVEITGNLRPKYLLGECGHIVSKPGGRAGDLAVELDRRVGKYGYQPVFIPAACLKKV